MKYINIIEGFKSRLRQQINSRVPRYKYREIAEGCGVSNTTVGLWVKKGEISDSNMEKLAIFLKVSPSWLKYGVATNDKANKYVPHMEGTESISADHSDQITYLQQRVDFLEAYILKTATAK